MLKQVLCFSIFLMYLIYVAGYIVDPGPKVIATKGEIWPQPKNQITESTYSVVRPSIFRFDVVKHSCDILEEGMLRYLRIIKNFGDPVRRHQQFRTGIPPQQTLRKDKHWFKDPSYGGYLDVLTIDLRAECELLPYLGMDETYTLSTIQGTATLQAYSIWGILRGLESFSQLLYVSTDGRTLQINSTQIQDGPRFPHRGLLVDTSRHFISMFTLYQILDGMAYNKLNVFHWHIVDDQSFPYESITFPELSEKGAYNPRTMTYSQEDIRAIIQYARVRGIRVLPEFDTPGHTRSWGVSHPEILTKCFGEFTGKLGPIDPTKEETYNFLNNLFHEIVQVFPEKYIHLGGDEVGFECWDSNPDIHKYMLEKNYTTFEQLEEEYIQKIVDQVTALNTSSMVWQEVFVNGVRLPPKTVIHVWTGDRRELLYNVTDAGLPALLSTCWYLDHLSTGGDWKKFYDCDPQDFQGTVKQKELVIGGEACMWSEVVDSTNVLQRIFPRVSATAEKLWSQFGDITTAPNRIEEQTCRMRFRGIPAQPPNGPGFCN